MNTDGGALRRRLGRLAALLMAACLLVPSAAYAARLNPLDVVIAIDDSGSEFGPNGTDPDAARYRAARFAAEFLGSTATAGLNHRLGVVRFGSDAPADRVVRLTRVPRDLGTIDAALRDPKDLGSTNFAAAIDRSATIFGPPTAGRKRLLIIFTDGIPFVRDGQSLNERFQGIRDSLGKLAGVDVAVLGVDRTGRFSDVIPQWEALDVRTVEALPSIKERDLARAFVRVLSSSLGLERGDEVELSGSQRQAEIDIDPYQEALAITQFSPDSATVVQAISPDGKVGAETTAGRAGLATADEPGPGRWTVRLSRGSQAIVAIDRVPLEAKLVEPSGSSIPVGRPLVLEATFRTSDGRVLPELSAFPRYFGATVTGPDGASAPVELKRVVPGLYRAASALPVTDPGEYRVTLTLKGAEQQALQTEERVVTAAIEPYFTATKTDVRSREPLSIPLELRLNESSINAGQILREDAASVGVARLFDASGKQLETVRIEYDSGSKFMASFKTKPDDDTKLTVVATLNATDREGRKVSGILRHEVSATPSGGDKAGDVVKTILVSLLGILVLLSVALATWWFTRPRVEGKFRIDGRVRPMRGRNMIVGSGWPLQPVTWVWGAGDGRVRARVGRLPLPFRSEEILSTAKSQARDIIG